MAVTYAAITTLMDAAVLAMASADYATARDKALSAQAILSVLPNVTDNTVDGGSKQMQWDRVALSKFIENCTRLANASAGIQTSLAAMQPLTNSGGNQLGVW